jgi:glutathione S-transferase
MILIGRYLSPFVRRVGVTLHWLDIAFEHRSLSPALNAEDIRPFNPMNKVPALVLDDGEILVESTLILDHLLETTPNQTLLPAHGLTRRDVLQRTGIMTSALDKSVATLYEKTKRPQEKIHQPFLDTLIEQATAGVDQIEALVKAGRFADVSQATLADLTAAVGYRFITATLPEVSSAQRHPALADLSAGFEATEAFKACQFKV